MHMNAALYILNDNQDTESHLHSVGFNTCHSKLYKKYKCFEVFIQFHL